MDNQPAQSGQTVSPTPQTPAPAPPEPTPTPPTLVSAPEAPTALPAQDKPFNPEPEDVPARHGTSQSEITWTASEFIAHAKSSGWYVILGLAAIAGAALIYLLTGDRISSAVIIVAAIFLGIYAGHKPRELEYRLDNGGLSVGEKHFTYDQFRSFAVVPEGAFSSIIFMPLRRFAVPTTIYYAPEDEDQIVNLLGSRLPLENQGHDALDRLIHRIHF